MKLAEILDTLESLDRAYETVEEEVRAALPELLVPAWESIVRERPRREPGFATGDLRCATHGGAPHGLAFDVLSDHLATEFAQWTRLAEHSDTVRGALGIERITPSPGARIGAMLHIDGDLELRAKLSATGDAVVPTEAGRWLWVREAPSLIDFRPRGAKGESYLLFSNDEKGRRWSFSEVRKGFEDYLIAAGRRPEEAALEALRSCPTPRLLGAVADYNARNGADRAPIALSEAWLWDGESGELGGALADPCEACRFGLSAWLCGHADMLARGPGANLDYAKRSRQWTDRLTERKPPRRARAAVGLDSDMPPAVNIPKGAKATDTLVSGEGLPMLPMTTRVRAPGAKGELPGAAVTTRREGGSGAAERPREPVRIRLESAAFSREDVEVREVHGRESMSRLFSFQVDVVCLEEGGLDVGSVLGAPAALVFEQGTSETRRVHGMVAEVLDRLESEPGQRSYRIWLVPRAWRSTLVEERRESLNTSVPQVLAERLSRAGIGGRDVEWRLRGSYPVRERVVQGDETDLAVIARLAEEAGISFFFEQDGGVDRLVLADEGSGWRPLRGAESLPFRGRGDKVDVFEIHARSRVSPAESGGVTDAAAGATPMYEGRSDRCELSPGGTFALVGHPRLPGLSLLVVDVEHHARQSGRPPGTAGGDEPYRNTFRAVDARLPYRARRASSKRGG